MTEPAKTRTHTWVINLDRSPDRLASISDQLDRLGLAWTRQRAVDARAFTPEQQALLDVPAYHRKHGKHPVPGELGCYLSHVEVMRAFLASDKDFALILEDDVQLGAELPAVLEALEQHPGRWDLVKLSAVHSGTPQCYLQLTPKTQLAVMLSRCTGSSAYLLNRRGAEAFLAGLLPMQLPYDHVFDQGWVFDLKIRLAVPPPCGHDQEVATTIVMPAKRKFHWTRRLPAFAYRAGNELRRLLYGLRETVRERRQGAA